MKKLTLKILTLLISLLLLQNSFGTKIILDKKDFDYSIETPQPIQEYSESINIDFSSKDLEIRNINRYSFIYERISNEIFAKFFTKEHGISLISSGNILGTTAISGVFSIYLLFCPIRIDDGTVIARLYSIEETDKMVNIKIEKSKIKIEINGIVKEREKEETKITLVSDDKIKAREFYELSLVFDIVNSKISMYVDGIENDRKTFKQANFDLSTKEGILEFFPEFIGYARSIIISPTFIRSRSKINQKTKSIISRIVDTKDFSTKMEKLSINGKGNFIILSRVSSDINKLLQNQVEWIPLEEAKQIKGRYVQFKIIPIQSDEPTDFQSLEIEVTKDIPPKKPKILSIDLKGEGEVTVNWENELDEEVEYYEIFYGDYENKYFGKESGPSPIKVKKPSKFYPVLSYTIKGLDNTKMYYFSIRSVRKDKTKSEYSDEFKIIPSKGVSKY